MEWGLSAVVAASWAETEHYYTRSACQQVSMGSTWN